MVVTIDFWLQRSGSHLLPYGVELCYLELGNARLLATWLAVPVVVEVSFFKSVSPRLQV